MEPMGSAASTLPVSVLMTISFCGMAAADEEAVGGGIDGHAGWVPAGRDRPASR